jgi:nucleotide-binding universal stress UspA family protein
MTQKRTRLIALIDFSLYSHALLELAGRWCKIAQADLLLMHEVVGLVPGMADKNSKNEIITSETAETQAKLEKLAQARIQDPINIKYHISGSNLLLSLEEVLKEGYNDYILIGIKGTGMLKRILMGSTATKIIEELNHITVAVPDKLCSAPNKLCNLLPKKIIVPISNKYPLNENAFTNFLNTFNPAIEAIEFVSVINSDDDEEKSKEYLISLTQQYNKPVASKYSIFKGNDVFEKLKAHVQQESDTILVVQKGSRSLTDQLFRKYLINQLVHDGSIPLVILPL